MKRPIRFTHDDYGKAHSLYGFNCGPGALCAILNLTPGELRPMMGDFEEKRYTNPTLMFDVLKRSGKTYRQTYRGDDPAAIFPQLKHGVVRIQWGGRWTKPGVPMRARYRHTHWVGAREDSSEIFDINAVNENGTGWLTFNVWATQLIPWLMEGETGWDKTWWATHAIEVAP